MSHLRRVEQDRVGSQPGAVHTRRGQEHWNRGPAGPQPEPESREEGRLPLAQVRSRQSPRPSIGNEDHHGNCQASVGQAGPLYQLTLAGRKRAADRPCGQASLCSHPGYGREGGRWKSRRWCGEAEMFTVFPRWLCWDSGARARPLQTVLPMMLSSSPQCLQVHSQSFFFFFFLTNCIYF